LLLLLVLWLWFLAIQIYHYSRESYSQPADVAIVLGAAVWNERPSPVFEERIKHAIDLYKSESVQAIIFTGGIGKGDRSAESQVAREYAILHGVPAEHVYYETRSRTTRENLQEAKRILDQRNLPNVVIVSDPLHMKRAVAIARDLGIAAQPSPTPTSRYRTWQSRLGFLLRETYYYASYLMRRPFISDVAPDLHTLSVQTIAMCRPLE
jgi:uncharacterized SAM-binding protein YcdF (DUF218 family)